MKTYSFPRPIDFGDKGTDVVNLQAVLIHTGFLKIEAPTGWYGTQTAQAVLAYQFSRNVAPEAELRELGGRYVGPKTRTALSQEAVAHSLIDVLILIESSDSDHPKGNDYAVGDKNLPDHAYGCLQIRKPCVDDVNRAYGTRYKALDCLGNRALSIEICQKYIDLYGKDKTDEQKARIWNGGPNGYKKASTLVYLDRYRQFL